MNKNQFLVLISMFIPFIARASGSVVGEGGDPVVYYLETARTSLRETIRLITDDPAEALVFCKAEAKTPGQFTVCRKFFAEASRQILDLNQETQKTPFLLREQPLLVTGINGKPIEVPARTSLGPAGGIELHRDSVKLASPAFVLMLITHEFSHKVLFENRYLTDNEVPGEFNSGRDLIDTFAAAMTNVAKRRGQIGQQFGLRDRFHCEGRINGQLTSIMESSTPRLFTSQDQMSYKTTLGKNPLDQYIMIPESIDVWYSYRLEIIEPANCSTDVGSKAYRNTKVDIIKVDRTNRASPIETVVNSISIQGYSPICDKAPQSIALGYKNIELGCLFIGTEATASAL